MILSPKIVINPSRTYEMLHCKKNHIGSVVREIIRYKQIDSLTKVLFLFDKVLPKRGNPFLCQIIILRAEYMSLKRAAATTFQLPNLAGLQGFIKLHIFLEKIHYFS